MAGFPCPCCSVMQPDESGELCRDCAETQACYWRMLARELEDCLRDGRDPLDLVRAWRAHADAADVFVATAKQPELGPLSFVVTCKLRHPEGSEKGTCNCSCPADCSLNKESSPLLKEVDTELMDKIVKKFDKDATWPKKGG